MWFRLKCSKQNIYLSYWRVLNTFLTFPCSSSNVFFGRILRRVFLVLPCFTEPLFNLRTVGGFCTCHSGRIYAVWFISFPNAVNFSWSHFWMKSAHEIPCETSPFSFPVSSFSLHIIIFNVESLYVCHWQLKNYKFSFRFHLRPSQWRIYAVLCCNNILIKTLFSFEKLRMGILCKNWR